MCPKANDVDSAPALLPFPVLVLGASAGGGEALRAVFAGMTKRPAAAIVVLTHAPADKKSHMPEVLAGFTGLPVREIGPVTPLESGVVYTTPAGHDLGIERGVLRLLSASHDLDYRIIDRFLESLAEDQGANSACAILSGTASDGTQGALRISRAGGLVLVQDPQTAAQPGMPESAIEAGVADLVLPPGELGARLPELLAAMGAQAGADTAAMERILEMIRQNKGQDLAGYRPSMLSRRIHKRRLLCGHLKLDSYLRKLEDDPEEFGQLYQSLFIGVTAFLRDPEAFKSLRDNILPSLLSGRAPDETLRLWVAGCSTGEEAYSLAMLMEERLEEAGLKHQFKIFATDIDQFSVERARKGLYAHRALQNLDPGVVERWFTAVGDDYLVRPRLRERIVFVHHNLLQDPPFLHMDMVVCRNLLIYLTPALQKRALELLVGALNPGGCLFLGSAESLDTHAFKLEVLDSKWRLFRKRVEEGHESQRQALALRRSMTLPGLPPLVQPPRAKSPSAQTTDALLEYYAPAAVLVGPEHNLLHTTGDTSPYLTITPGEASLNLLRLVRKELRQHLRKALSEAAASGRQVRVRGLRLNDGGLNLGVVPLKGDTGELSALLVVFERASQPEPSPQARVFERLSESGIVQRYEEELQLTQEQLVRAVDDYERLTEELRASNEELLSMNEELQSSNEEMDASREELQSLNEELSVKVEELAQGNSFVENLLRSANVPTVFLDRELRIMRATPAARDIFHVAVADAGRPITEIKSRVRDEALSADAQAALSTGRELEREVQGRDRRTFLKRVFPYLSPRGEIDGVVLSYADITRLKEAEEVLRESNEQLESQVAARTRELEDARRESERRAAELEAIMEQVPAAVWISRDGEARTIIGNQASYRLLRMSPGANVSKAVDGTPYTPTSGGRPLDLMELPMQRAARGEIVTGQEIDLLFADGQVRTILGNAAPLRNFLGETYGAVGAFLDITELKAVEVQARRWQRVFEDAKFGLAIANVADHTFLAVNPSFARERGYEPEELVGQPILNMYPEAMRQEVMGHVKALDATGHGVFESLHMRKDGSSFPVLLELTVLRDAQGRPVQRVAHVMDISARKQAERASLESLAKLEAALASMTDAVFISDAQGNFVHVNDAFVTYHKFRNKQECSRNIADCPEILDVFFENGEPVPAEQWAMPRALRGEAVANAIYHLRRKDTGERWTGSYSFAPIRDAAGAIVGSVVVGRDITERQEAEQKLQALGSRLGLALEAAKAGIWEWDLGTDENFWSPEVFRLYDLDPDGAAPSYDAWLSAVHPEQREEMVARVSQAAMAREPISIEFLVNTRDGSERWLLSLGQPQTNASGHVVRYLGIVLDITERKRVETKLRESQARFQDLFRSSPVPLGVMDASGRVIDLNSRFTEVFGYTQEDIPTLEDWRQRAYPDPAYRETIRPVWDQGLLKTTAAGAEISPAEFRITCKNGEQRFVIVAGIATSNHIVASFTDITERRRTEDALRQSELKFRTVADYTQDWEYWRGSDGGIIWVSPACEQITGYAPREFMEIPGLAFDIIHPEDKDRFREHLDEVDVLEGEHWDIEIRIIRKDGEEIWVNHKCRSIRGEDGASLGRRACNTDITARKEAQEALLAAKSAAEAANKAKSEFLANMSHEIRTPLNGILGMLQLIKGGATPDEQATYSDMALQASRRLLGLLNDILDYSRLEAGRINLARASFKLSEVFESVRNVFQVTLEGRPLQLEHAIHQSLPAQLVGDESRIRQILFNLVGNAIKFTRQGFVRFEAWAQPFAANPRKIHLYLLVRDTGIGIPDDKVSHVFQRFTQSDASYTRQYEGAGLGLAIVKRLVDAMEGDIAVDSAEGHGTAIYVHLPVALPAAAVAASAHPASATPIRPMRILVAEDEETSSIALATMLRRMGHRVSAVANGLEAVQAVKAEHFDCVFMDIQMPVLNGLDATGIIRGLQDPPGRAGVWIIALTAYALSGDREKFLAAGMDDYVSKPAQYADLEEAMKRVRPGGRP